MSHLNKDLWSGTWRSLVELVLCELPIIQTKSIAITRLWLNITIHLVKVSEAKFNKEGV